MPKLSDRDRPLTAETPVRIGLFSAVSVRSWPPFPPARAPVREPEPQRRRACRRDEWTCPRRRRHAPRDAAGDSVAELARISHHPHVRVPAAADAVDQLELARREQRGPRAPVCPVRDTCRRAQLLGREVAHGSVLVRDRGHRCQQQPLGSADPAVAQHRLEELDVDLAVPPRTGVGEQEGDRARSTTAGGALVDGHQAARDELLPRLLIAAPAQSGARRRGRRARPRAVLAAGEARERERHQALA